MIPNFDDMAQMVAAGFKHSLILTRSGLVYAFGSNEESQLGCPARRSSSLPVCIQDIAHVPMRYIAAGSFSASIAKDSGNMYLWGDGTWGNFQQPHRVKKIEERVSCMSIGDQFGACISETAGGTRKLYTWGVNSFG